MTFAKRAPVEEAEYDEETEAKVTEVLEKFISWQAARAIARRLISPETVGLRAIAALWVVRPEMFGGVSLHNLSKKVGLGVTDTILSRYAAEFRDTYNFKGRSQRTEITRAKMRSAQRKPGVHK